MFARFGVNISVAQLNSLSHAAHDGNGVFSGNKVNKIMTVLTLVLSKF